MPYIPYKMTFDKGWGFTRWNRVFQMWLQTDLSRQYRFGFGVNTLFWPALIYEVYFGHIKFGFTCWRNSQTQEDNEGVGTAPLFY